MAELNWNLLAPQRSVGESFMQGMQQADAARAVENQNALAQYQLEAARQGQLDATAEREAWRGAAGYDDVQKRLMAAGQGRRALEVGKLLQEQRTRGATLQKTEGEIVEQEFKNHARGLINVTTPDEAAEWVRGIHANPRTRKALNDVGVTLDIALRNIPADPAKIPAWAAQAGAGAQKAGESQLTTPAVRVSEGELALRREQAEREEITKASAFRQEQGVWPPGFSVNRKAATPEEALRLTREWDALGVPVNITSPRGAGGVPSANALIPGEGAPASTVNTLAPGGGAPMQAAPGVGGLPPNAARAVQMDLAKKGLRQRADGIYEHIPGGPADPAVISAREAPVITTIQDPTDPLRTITVDTRKYGGGGMGSPGVIGVGGKTVAVAAAEKKKEEGAERFLNVTDNLRVAYENLNRARAIPSEQRSAISNALSYIASTGTGQLAGRIGGTSNQTQREVIASARNILLTAVKDATGMSAQQLNSNVEFKTWLDSLTDPTKSIEANLAILDNLEKFIASKGKPGTPTKPSAPSSSGAPPSTGWGKSEVIDR